MKKAMGESSGAVWVLPSSGLILAQRRAPLGQLYLSALPGDPEGKLLRKAIGRRNPQKGRRSRRQLFLGPSGGQALRSPARCRLPTLHKVCSSSASTTYPQGY